MEYDRLWSVSFMNEKFERDKLVTKKVNHHLLTLLETINNHISKFFQNSDDKWFS